MHERSVGGRGVGIVRKVELEMDELGGGAASQGREEVLLE